VSSAGIVTANETKSDAFTVWQQLAVR